MNSMPGVSSVSLSGRGAVSAARAPSLSSRAAQKSPLRYPGGKSRAVKTIMEFIPPGLNRLCSPFIGGGSVELACAARGIDVRGYDLFAPLVNFWRQLFADRELLAERVETLHPMSRAEFYGLQKRFMSIKDPAEQAAAFFALNRASYSGATMSGGMSPGHARFTKSSIEALRRFEHGSISVACADYKESIAAHGGDFLYLDPPYANGQALYGSRGDCHTRFDHEGLADILRGRDGWLLSYNDCAEVRRWYDGRAILTPAWTYGMNNNARRSSEVLVLSRDLARAA